MQHTSLKLCYEQQNQFCQQHNGIARQGLVDLPPRVAREDLVHFLPRIALAYLIPGSVGEHASKEGVHVPSIHGLAVLFDALCISKDQTLPQQGVALPEAV